MLKAGETQRFQCNECNREFEVTLEPKAKDAEPSKRPTDTAVVGTCPFDNCGSADIEEC